MVTQVSHTKNPHSPQRISSVVEQLLVREFRTGSRSKSEFIICQLGTTWHETKWDLRMGLFSANASLKDPPLTLNCTTSHLPQGFICFCDKRNTRRVSEFSGERCVIHSISVMIPISCSDNFDILIAVRFSSTLGMFLGVAGDP